LGENPLIDTAVKNGAPVFVANSARSRHTLGRLAKYTDLDIIVETSLNWE